MKFIELQVLGNARIDRFSQSVLAVKRTGDANEQFELSNGNNKLSLSDEKLILNAGGSGSALTFSSANLISNKLTIVHSAGRKFITGLACTTWPKQVSYVSENQLQLDFTGIELTGTQQVWFDGIEGAQIQ